MPRGIKICPSCQTTTGPRSFNCPECGHAFAMKAKKGAKRRAKSAKPTKPRFVRQPIDTSPLDFKTLTPRPKSTGPINLNPKGYFDHLFDREGQIEVLLGGVQTAVETDFKVRSHALVIGPPAAGKSSLMDAFVNMVGEEHVYRVDMTAATQAGILQDLIDRGSMIKFIIIEEVEKCNANLMLRWLLGVMDERGELRVCNARLGYIQAPLKAFVIATTNDASKVESLMDGALASRFSDKIYCPRVDDDAIFKAVKRYVDMVDGNDAWIKPAIRYVREVEGVNDIRRIKTVAMNGRDRLLTGEYQKILMATRQLEGAGV
jgi:hypothetical protein